MHGSIVTEIPLISFDFLLSNDDCCNMTLVHYCELYTIG